MENLLLQTLKDVCEGCSEKKIPLALLRPKKFTAKEAFRGDYDFICNRSNLEKVFGLFFFKARENGIHITAKHPKPDKWVLKIWHHDTSKRIIVELWTHIEIKIGKSGKWVGYISSLDVMQHMVFKTNSVSFIRHEVASLIYITHLYHKEKDINSEEVRWRINYYLECLQNKKGNSLFETEPLSATLALISSITKGGSLKNASSEAVKLLKAYDVSGKYGFAVRTKRVLWRTWQYKRKHVLHPIITVVGPDGTGKTSTIQLLKSHCLDLRKDRYRSFRFKSMFRLFYPLSWWIKLIQKKTNQKRNKVEEKFSSTVLSVAFLMITAAYCIILRKEKWLVDRYFYDYYYQGIRNENEGRLCKTLFSKLFERFVPRPRLLIVCHCPEQERQTRKPRELRTTSANKLYKTYIQQTLKDRALKSIFMSSSYPINDSPKLIKQLCKEI